MMTAEQIQRLIDRQADCQRQVEQVLAARAAGDEEAARFYELPREQQQRLLTEQDIADASAAARQGDEQGTVAHIQSAVWRQIGGAQLRPRDTANQKPRPRRRIS